ncbi:DUF5677 domain-containing protein [Xanthomonas campestris]|uniref:DUF5677 domain-containing protein n=1 Tax=Xanthomonas campestris TaxID=339 RepID=UPI002B239A09|nr:DUF5677 domain-containing protein [Xanthomonas campestris]MEA9729184.1 DUF5677 domain-containing protein [Xanthomonas campestris pv. raphani]
MTDDFDLLKQQIPALEKISEIHGEIGFFAQEALRFCTIAGTLCATFPLDNSSIGERQITHILARSLLENYFWLIYIFDDQSQRSSRYGEKINGFKREYSKLMADPLVPKKDEIEPADPTWSSLPKPMDVNSMLAQVKNDLGDRLSYLYFVYRVASFDTHGNSMAVLFEQAFGQSCSFSALDLKFGFDLIANQYLVILQELAEEGAV